VRRGGAFSWCTHVHCLAAGPGLVFPYGLSRTCAPVCARRCHREAQQPGRLPWVVASRITPHAGCPSRPSSRPSSGKLFPTRRTNTLKAGPRPEHRAGPSLFLLNPLLRNGACVPGALVIHYARLVERGHPWARKGCGSGGGEMYRHIWRRSLVLSALHALEVVCVPANPYGCPPSVRIVLPPLQR
jgi:hypothetical protein